VFAFLDTVESRGGGTLVVAGSHRLLNEGRFLRVKDLRDLLCRETFFRELCSEASSGLGDRARLLGQVGAVGDVTLEVLELTGSPGDAYFTDLRALHTAAPNAASYPRIMATDRFVPVDVMRELAEALGWE
jgi:ectoine hydroxylase-related dioxygenase (phytanoyl-CoA dioxygenase family)